MTDSTRRAGSGQHSEDESINQAGPMIVQRVEALRKRCNAACLPSTTPNRRQVEAALTPAGRLPGTWNVVTNCLATGFVHSRRLTACARPEADHWLATAAVASGIGIELPSSRPWPHPITFPIAG